MEIDIIHELDKLLCMKLPFFSLKSKPKDNKNNRGEKLDR